MNTERVLQYTALTIARDKFSTLESRKNIGDLLVVEPSLSLTVIPVTLLPDLRNEKSTKLAVRGRVRLNLASSTELIMQIDHPNG